LKYNEQSRICQASFEKKVFPQTGGENVIAEESFFNRRLSFVAKGFLRNDILGDLRIAKALQKQKATACPCGRNRGRTFKTA
jgi:hypothetical protein